MRSAHKWIPCVCSHERRAATRPFISGIRSNSILTVKIAKRPPRIYEVGISHWERTYEEGWKIGRKDGLRTRWCPQKRESR